VEDLERKEAFDELSVVYEYEFNLPQPSQIDDREFE
jgi:hypothetical protein